MNKYFLLIIDLNTYANQASMSYMFKRNDILSFNKFTHLCNVFLYGFAFVPETQLFVFGIFGS
jgi:hypothetical protein